MLVYDESFAAVMTTTQDEATRLGARAYGSEHVLLGLLGADVDLTRDVVRAHPELTAQAVRTAVEQAADDAPHLARLGLAPGDVAASPADAPARRLPPRNKHTPELQTALDTASATWGHLRRTHALPRERRVGSAVLWLAVLEPAARSARLLAAMGVDVDGIRGTVLGSLAGPGAPVPAWPAQAPVGRVARLVRRVLARTNVAS